MRAKILAVVGWSVVGVAMLAGAGDRGEARLRRLVIEDEKGDARIVLEMRGDCPTITIRDGRGDERFRARADDHLSYVGVDYFEDGFGAGKTSRSASISVGALVAPRLALYDGEAPKGGKSEREVMLSTDPKFTTPAPRRTP